MKILILAGPSSLPHLDALRQAGHQILVCERLEEAEAVLYAHAETIDLIWLSDKEGPSAARLNPMGLGFFQGLQHDPLTANIPVVISAEGWSQKEVDQFAKSAHLPHGLIHGQLTSERVLEAFQEVVLTSMPAPPGSNLEGEVEFEKLEIEIPGLASPPPIPNVKSEVRPQEKSDEIRAELSQIKPLFTEAGTKVTLFESDSLLKPVPLIDEELSIRFEPFEEKVAAPAVELSVEQAEAVLEEALSFDLSLEASKSELMAEDQGLLNRADAIQPAAPIQIEVDEKNAMPELEILAQNNEVIPSSLALPLEPAIDSLLGVSQLKEPNAETSTTASSDQGEQKRALEQQLDLCMRDASARLRVREQKLLELQRRLDMAEFNVEILTQALQKERQQAQQLESKLKKVMVLLNSVSEGAESDLRFR